MILLRLRFWLLLLLVGAVWWYGESGWQELKQVLKTAPPLDARLQEQVRQVTGYQLPLDQWLTFPLILNGDRLRILSNGELPPEAATEDPRGWHYALAYRLLDSGGREMEQGIYHHYTRITRFSLGDSTEKFTPAFFREEAQLLADTRILPLNLKALPRNLTLQLRLEAHDPIFRGVVVRVSQQEKIEEAKLQTLWQRLNLESREGIATATLYPADLLHRREQENLLREMWRPLGPRGVPERDYTPRPFLVWEEAVEMVADTPYVPSDGIEFGGLHQAVISLPEEGGDLRLELSAAREEMFTLPITLYGLWMGRQAEERRDLNWQWQGEAVHLSLERGGKLWLKSSQPLVVRAFLTRDGREEEITPDPAPTAVWRVDGEEPLRFALHPHPEAEATPHRLQLRAVALPQQREVTALLPATAEVQWRLLDRTEAVISTASVQWQPVASPYDWVETPLGRGLASLPEMVYLPLPPEGAALEISAPAPLWIALANRPPGLVKESKVPEDAYPFADEGPLPTWFTLRPQGWRQRRQQGDMVLLRQQPDLNETEEWGGEPWRWRSYFPQDGHSGRYLLLPRAEGGEPLAPELRSSGYRQLPLHRPLTLRLLAEPHRETLTPRLIYLWHGAQQQRCQLRLYRDGELWWQGPVVAGSGEILLPSVAVGRHQLHLKSKCDGEMKLFLSNAPAPTEIRRYAERLQPGVPLTYAVEKEDRPEPQILSARIYHRRGEAQRSRIRMTLQPQQRRKGETLRDWSWLSRRYDLRPPQKGERDQEAIAIATQAWSLDQGEFFSIPLGRDLPPGSYRLTLTLEEGPGLYLTLGEAEGEIGQGRFHFVEGVEE
ncbi:MAG: hypothetical protein HQL48_08830 [Gammaproteobacteria bacterium]|nr:hypothetical protein [Gammaproteobacteria bacterium]